MNSTDLLKNKSRPEAAAAEAAEWVESERALREKLKKEREARELKEKEEVSHAPPVIAIDHRPSSSSGMSCPGASAAVVYSLADCVVSAARTTAEGAA